jgi:outer membrane lipoprotein-sorting protein
MKMDFKFTTTSTQTNESNTESGKLIMKGDKYHLTFLKSDIFFDGKSVYTYLNKANEVNITKPETTRKEKGNFFFSNPRDLFKAYNKDFKSKLMKETSINDMPCYEIDLYPIDLKTNYLRLRMHIDKTSFQIIDMKLFLKDGTQYLLEFSNFVANINIPDTEFVFDAKNYPDVQVNDMRF